MFLQLKLDPVLLENTNRLGYTEPTPIQLAAIPPALAGLDVVATAETGSGKTAAFLLPISHRLMASTGGKGRVRALILCPTREIALQTEGEAHRIGHGTGLKSTAIYGGVGYGPQLEALRRGVDVVVATPGRLLDHVGRRTINLGQVEILILDEADRMLDMGFLPDIRRIVAQIPKGRQTLLYSATMPREILALSEKLMSAPVRVAVGEVATPPGTVCQSVCAVKHEDKTPLLMQLLRGAGTDSVLVFTRTKHRADRVSRQLARAGVAAACIHGNRTQRQREVALDGFRRGRIRVLVATDIAARGLDVPGITHVINYDMPSAVDDYVHRIGRTARAGAVGQAVSLVTSEDLKTLQSIEHSLGCRIPEADISRQRGVAVQ